MAVTYTGDESRGGWYHLQPTDSEPAENSPDERAQDAVILRAGTPIGLPVSKGHGEWGRTPVVVVGDPPVRRPVDQLPGSRPGLPIRRPVVALLDTVVGSEQALHPWLAPTGEGVFVEESSWKPEPPNEPQPRTIGAVDEPLGSHAGHGTFIAGLIRQVAPDARVLIMRAMHADGGKVYEHHLESALTWLRDRVRAESTDGFVDVICLALGYHRSMQPRDDKFTERLGNLLGELGNLGVRVVASAGNDGTNERTYPAAFADARNQPRTALVSVGACDPDGRTHSSYTAQGRWITDWEIGTAVVSTMPAFNGPGHPGADEQEQEEHKIDPDDFTGGFARWSGTSFAAGVFAGRLAQALVNTGVLGDPTLDAHQRAAAALAVCRPHGTHR